MNGSMVVLNIIAEDLKYAEINDVGGEKRLLVLYHEVFAEGHGDEVAALKRIIAEQRPLTPRTLLVISSRDLTYREFSFPFDSPKKVNSAIRFEISSEFPAQEYVLDTIETLSKEPGKKTFMAAIARKEMLRRRIQTAEEAGLHVVGITSDLSTLGNYFVDEDEALVMDTGENHTLFGLFGHGLPLIVRDIPIGVSQLRTSIARDGAKDLRSLTGEIKRTLHSFNIKTGQTVDRVFVSGSILLESKIFEALKKSTELSLEEATPVTAVFKTDEVTPPLNSYAALLGAAWWKRRGRSFNLFKEEFSVSESEAAGRSYFRWAALVAGGVLFALFSSTALDMMVLQKREAFLAQEIRKTFSSSFPGTKKGGDEVKQAKNILNARLMELGGANPSSKITFLEIMQVLSRTIPEKTSFEIISLFWERGKVEIGSKTDSFKSVNAIQEVLSKAGNFSEVIISNAKSRDDGKTVEFTLTLRFES
jgi:type II secretory pathway component PulL